MQEQWGALARGEEEEEEEKRSWKWRTVEERRVNQEKAEEEEERASVIGPLQQTGRQGLRETLPFCCSTVTAAALCQP